MGKTHFAQVSWALIILWTLIGIDLSVSKKILVFCPSFMYSHHNVYKSIVTELLKRGHEVVYVTGVPNQIRSTPNYTEIDTSGVRESFSKLDTYYVYDQLTWFEFKDLTFNATNQIVQFAISQPKIQRLYADGESGKFHLLLYEVCTGPILTAFAYRLKVPLIGISTLDLHVAERHNFAAPVLPSHSSNYEWGIKTGRDLSFWQRVKSFVYAYYHIYRYNTYVNDEQRRLAKELLGHVTPDIVELQRNTNLVLIENHPILSYPKPEQPNFIKFSSIHLPDKTPKLPKELKAFLGSATDGIIYMSLGTTMQSKDMPKEKLQTFINVFSSLPYKVVWKFETNDIEVNTNNIYLRNWLPQYAVLAHPNTKLFMYQGGLQSTDEAIHNAVPMIGFPCMHDQYLQITKLVSLGVAKTLNLRDVTEQTLNETIFEVIYDRSYKDNILKIRDVLKDKAHDDLRDVVWWIEYIIRHNGAPFLQFSGIHDPWYKRYDIDVIAFLASALSLSVIFAGYVLCVTVSWLVKAISPAKRTKKQKSH